ncbi:NAD-dependent epimerase/dehydratase family protein [Synechococcus sp. AH-224-G16]|nr:NAD-dependent epimerase/dehydratase family protein [Synechococcus sp. AH-224-G16]
MPKRVLITGGSGFIATYVASVFVQHGYEVVLQTRGNGVCNDLINNKLVKLLSCSIFALTPEDLNDVDSIIHLASAGVSPQKASWNELEEVNVRGVLSMCQLALKLKAKLVVAGSFAEYGKSGLKYNFIPVDAPLEPTFPYSISKAAGCNLALGFARSEGLSLAYLRIFNAFGKRQHESNLWPSLVAAALAGRDFDTTPGEQVRDFIPVKDVADQFFNAIDNTILKPGRPYVSNVASGKPQMIKDFCHCEWNKYSKGGSLNVGTLPYRPSEVMRCAPSMESKYL